MKVWLPLLLFVAGIGLLFGCKKNKNNPIPDIYFLALHPDTIKGGSPFDTAYLTFNFQDGDGDLGNDITQGVYDVYLRDLRDSAFPLLRFPFPTIPDEARDPINGIKGTGSIALLGIDLIPRQDTIHKYQGDTVIYDMWIVDRAQHQSNIIRTTPLYIRP
jgi:hypothetical protein